MKTLLAFLALTLISVPLAYPLDLTLKDGRVLRDAVVVKEDAATVTVRHTGGFTQVDKTKLPESLLTEYPLDAAQAKIDAAQQQDEAAARAKEAKELYTLRLQQSAAAPTPPPPAADTAEPKKTDDSSTTAWVEQFNRRSLRESARRDHEDRYDGDRPRRNHHADEASAPQPLPPAPQPAPSRTAQIVAVPHAGVDQPSTATSEEDDTRREGARRGLH